MPLAVTPAATVIFFPFVLASKLGLGIAKSAWCGFSVAALALATARFRSDWRSCSNAERLRLAAAGVVAVGSNAFFTTLWLGQTSLFFVASLIVLLDVARRREGELPVAALLYIGLKPTYFGLGALLLIAFRAWKLLGIAIGLLALECGVLTLLSGPSWMGEYVEMFSMFGRSELDPRLRAPFAFDQMNLFRSAWLRFASDTTLLAVSRIVLAGAVFVGAVGIAREVIATRAGGTPLPGVRRFVGLLGMYFLFAPYGSTYEDIALAFPVFLLLALGPRVIASPRFLVALLLLFGALNFLTLLTPTSRELLWLGKAALLVSYLVLLSSNESPLMSAAEGRSSAAH